MKKRLIVSFVMSLLFLLMTSCASSDTKQKEYQADKSLVVLAHGLGRSDWAMWRFAQRLEDAGFNVCRLDYATLGESVESVLAETNNQIDACIMNQPKVHFVGHSLGGLVIRAYLQNHKNDLASGRIGEIVLIGTPNRGSELADHLRDSWLMKIGGGISRALMTGEHSLGNKLEELDLNIGVIAGTKPSSLTSKNFTGPNDGLVSVASTKLRSMSDFITIEVGHSAMRTNDEVIAQTIHFLQNGVFSH